MPKHYVSNKDESVRMFKSDFMEMFSKMHYTVPLIIFVPVIGFFLYKSFFIFNHSLIGALGLFICGAVVWTLTEYVIHRFVFHYRPASKLGRRLHFIFHGVHHDYPNDSKRLVFPPLLSIPLAVSFYYLFKLLLGEYHAAPFFMGFIVGYLFYDLGHYAVHHFNMRGKFWIAIKNHHMRHHYHDSDNGYGVSSPLWDHIFGTYFKKKG